jgi:hypothetical protein
MGNIIDSHASSFTRAIPDILAKPLDFLSGKTCIYKPHISIHLYVTPPSFSFILLFLLARSFTLFLLYLGKVHTFLHMSCSSDSLLQHTLHTIYPANFSRGDPENTSFRQVQIHHKAADEIMFSSFEKGKAPASTSIDEIMLI